MNDLRVTAPATIAQALPAVSEERWQAAQRAERGYWEGTSRDPTRIAEIVAGLSASGVWLRDVLPDPVTGDVLEMGVGPLGLACAHFLPDRGPGTVTVVDPLAQLPLDELPRSGPLLACVEAARRQGTYVQARGEDTGLPDRAYALVVVHNALDHVRDPLGLLREAARLLPAGGLLFLSCQTYPLVNQLRFRWWTTRLHADSILVQAHPFRFRVGHIERLVGEAGFAIVDSNRQTRAGAGWLGHGHVLHLLARRS